MPRTWCGRIPSLLPLLVLLALCPELSEARDRAPAGKPQPVLRAYGPGGPAPAMREAAKAFGEARGIRVEIVAGPTAKWKARAMRDADLIFSGSEHMMSDFVHKDLPGLVDTTSIRSLHLRASAILVRRGNPEGIAGVKDLAKPGMRLLVVHGAGQTGLWEDVAGRTGDVRLVDAVRRNIAFSAPNTGEAKKVWAADTSLDAWLVWTIWHKENPAGSDLVATEPEHTIYRSCGIAIARRTDREDLAREFADFLQSDPGKAIFVKWGWKDR